MPPTTLARYVTLIRAPLAAAPPAFDPQTEADDTIQVERGVCFPATLVGAPTGSGHCIDRLLQPAAPTLRIVDQRGHRRPAYRGLLIYAALQTLHVTAGAPPDWKPGLRAWAALMANDLAQLDWPTHPAARLPAASGAATTGAAWNALAVHVAAIVYDEPHWRTLAATTFDQFARRQLSAGPFLAAGPADNPETHWYHELVLLHAIASYAIQSGDVPLTAAVARSAEFHQAETQPDHATNQPWGLPAFVLHPATHALADQLLHTATTLAGTGGSAVSGVTSILLGDALYCLRRLTAM